MKKIATLCLLIAIARFTSAQKTDNFFDNPKFELQMVFADCFVKTAVTAKNGTQKTKFTHKYEITNDAIVIYERTIFGTSTVDPTYADKWFYIPLKDLYLITKETINDVFTESTEIALTNKLHRIIAGKGTKYNLADKNNYLQTAITFPFILKENRYHNVIEYLDSALAGLRNEGEDNTANSTTNSGKAVAPKREEVKPAMKNEYYPTGELKSETPMINGKIEGKQKYYYKSGKLAFYNVYKNNFKNGAYEFFFENGRLRQKNDFKNDKIHGEFKEYHDNGAIKIESVFTDGKHNGYENKYDKDGRLLSRQYYVMGKISGTLDICEGINYLIEKLDDKTYNDLNDYEWRKENFKGIIDFEYSNFFRTDPIFMTRWRSCTLTYLPEPGSNQTLFSQYDHIKSQLNGCKKLKEKSPSIADTGTLKSAHFTYNKLLFVTINADAGEKAAGIKLTITRIESEEGKK